MSKRTDKFTDFDFTRPHYRARMTLARALAYLSRYGFPADSTIVLGSRPEIDMSAALVVGQPFDWKTENIGTLGETAQMWLYAAAVRDSETEVNFYPVVRDAQSADIMYLTDSLEWVAQFHIYAPVDVTPPALVSVP